MPHALLIDNDEKTLHPLVDMFEQLGFSSHCARTVGEARAFISTHHDNDLVMLDPAVCDGTDFDFLNEISNHESTVVLMTEKPRLDSAVLKLRKQVRDYIPKPLDTARVRELLEGICRDGASRKSNGGDRRSQPQPVAGFGPMLGNCDAMRQLYHLIARVAPTDATVLITGESGAGKELVAQTVHQRSQRRQKKMICINCGAVPQNLIESELFGHEKGAFTGASGSRRGVFERASGSTLFLDEITEMPMDLQVRLLRVLETQKITRVGGEEEIDVDVRVVAATNRDPGEAVEEGKLREDLLYRLSVFPIRVPSLRERDDDVELLALHFLSLLNRQNGCAKTLAPQTLDRIRQLPWPGNVRQLKNMMQRAFILADSVLEPDSIPTQSCRPGGGPAPDGTIRFTVGMSIRDVEKEMIQATLARFDGDKRRAATTLGISLKTLYNRLNAYSAEGDGEPVTDSDDEE